MSRANRATFEVEWSRNVLMFRSAATPRCSELSLDTCANSDLLTDAIS